MQRKISKQYFTTLGKAGAFFISAFLLASPVSADDLVNIFNLAVENDPQIRQARAEYGASHTNISQSRSQLLPSISITGSTALQETSQDFSFSLSDSIQTKSYGLSIRQNLLDFEAWYSLQASKKSDLVSATNLAISEQQLIQRVASAYFDVLRSQDNLATFQAELDASERILEQTRQRFEVGLIPITDVHESQASYDLARVNLLMEENSLHQRYEALEAITGKSHSRIKSLTEDFPIVSVEPESLEEWVSVSQRNNLDLKAAQLNYESKDESVKAAKAALLPTLDVSAGYNWNDSGIAQFGFATPNGRNNVTLNLTIPLYMGGNNYARKRQAYYNRNASEEALLRTQRSSIQNTRNSYRNVENDVLTVAARAQAIVSAQSQLEATEVGAEVGTRNIVDVVVAQRLLFQALRDHANARYNYVIDTLNLKQAAGILNPQDIIDLNAWLD